MNPNMAYTYSSAASPRFVDPRSWPTSAAMARGSSHGSGSSEKSNHSATSSGSSNSQYMTLSPCSGGKYEPYSPTDAENYVVDSGGYGKTHRKDEKWYQYYDFITGDSTQPPHWRLKLGYTPSADYPQTTPVEQTPDVPRSANDIQSSGLHVCLQPGCTASPFRRKADLQRHYRHIHQEAEKKQPFKCDRRKCPRNKEPFFRLDHCRDHYRDYHIEDIARRGSHKETRGWWEQRKVDNKWWRCPRCLGRIVIQESGFECANCKTTCEPERRRLRGYD